MFSEIDLTVKDANWSGGETIKEMVIEGPCDFKIENGFMIISGDDGKVFGVNGNRIIGFKCYPND